MAVGFEPATFRFRGEHDTTVLRGPTKKNGVIYPNLTLTILQTRLLQTHRFRKKEDFFKHYFLSTVPDTQAVREKKTEDFLQTLHLKLTDTAFTLPFFFGLPHGQFLHEL